MHKHFVTFYSPGTFFSEESRVPVDSWNIEEAQEIAHTIKQRYGATPYGFRFITRSRDDNDLDSKQTAQSVMYFLGGKIETLEEVEARNDPREDILRSNMRCNRYDRIIINDNSWRFTGPLNKDDMVLDWKPREEAPDHA